MTVENEFRVWAKQLARQFHPEKIILFGSYAYGQPAADSDVDLLVIVPHTDTAIQKASEIRMALPRGVAIDVIVRSPEEVQKRLGMNDYFIRDILEKGRVLYAADNV